MSHGLHILQYTGGAVTVDGGTSDRGHLYRSTACLHALSDPDLFHLHGCCRIQCKWCESKCLCACHRDDDDDDEGMQDRAADVSAPRSVE